MVEFSTIQFDVSNLTANSGLIANLLYYAFFAAGSITLGYIFLRLLQPQIREQEKPRKLTKAVLGGAVFFILAISFDYLTSGQEKFLQANGFLASFAVLLLGLAITVHKVMELMHHKQVAQPTQVEKLSKQVEEFDQITVKNVPEKHGFLQTVFEKKTLQPEPELPRITKLKTLAEKTSAKTINNTHSPPTPAVPEVTATPPSPALQQPLLPTAPVTQEGFLSKIFSTFKKKPEAALKPTKKPYEEVDSILTELNVVTPLPQQAKTTPKTSAAPATTANPLHRLYMQKQQEANQQSRVQREATEGKALAEKQDKEELNELYKDLTPALKPEPKQAASVVQTKPAPKPQTPQKQEKKEEKPLLMTDLFGEPSPVQSTTQAPATTTTSSSLFTQLETSFPQAKQPQASVVKQASPTNCPNCHAKTNKIIYCPYCGSALCANCTPSLKPTPDAFIYTCPKCREEITVKKQAPA